MLRNLILAIALVAFGTPAFAQEGGVDRDGPNVDVEGQSIDGSVEGGSSTGSGGVEGSASTEDGIDGSAGGGSDAGDGGTDLQ